MVAPLRSTGANRRTTWTRRACFAACTILAATLLPLTALTAIDVHLHHKFERGVLYNVWGYRGPALPAKARDEYRVAVLGGSAAFGFGVAYEESMPALLDDRIRRQQPSVRVVNLAYNSQGAHAFIPTMEDYAYLRADAIVLYESYNDLLSDPAQPTHEVFRRESPVFRLTGYLPLFTIVAREKASVLLYGDTRAVYANAQHAQTVFTPGAARKASAAILRSAAVIGDSLERQFDRIVAHPAVATPPAASASGCGGTWRSYCELVYDAIRWAHSHHMQVLVATPPYLSGERLHAANIAQQREIAEMIGRTFPGSHDVRYVNLGNAIDLQDPALSFDRMHLTVEGNARIAAALEGPLLDLSGRRIPGN
jgi:hypothetical protein